MLIPSERCLSVTDSINYYILSSYDLIAACTFSKRRKQRLMFQRQKQISSNSFGHFWRTPPLYLRPKWIHCMLNILSYTCSNFIPTEILRLFKLLRLNCAYYFSCYALNMYKNNTSENYRWCVRIASSVFLFINFSCWYISYKNHNSIGYSHRDTITQCIECVWPAPLIHELGANCANDNTIYV